MHSITRWIIAASGSPIGVIVLAAADSTLFFSLPFGIDAAVMILAAKQSTLTLVVPLLATLGGVAGAALTFWMGKAVGEKGLDRYVSAKKLERVHRRIETSGAIGLAVLDLIPPPFPFTAFVLAAGALEVNASTFFITLAITRMVRFGAEAYLANRYGPHIIAWLESDVVTDIVLGFMAVAIILTVVSLTALWRARRKPQHRLAA